MEEEYLVGEPYALEGALVTRQTPPITTHLHYPNEKPTSHHSSITYPLQRAKPSSVTASRFKERFSSTMYVYTPIREPLAHIAVAPINYEVPFPLSVIGSLRGSVGGGFRICSPMWSKI